MNDNIHMDTEIEGSMNDNIHMDTEIEGSMNENIYVIYRNRTKRHVWAKSTKTI